MTYIKLETLAEASTPYGAPDSPASPTATDSTRTSPERSSESVDPETHEADDDNDKRPTKKRKSWGQVLPEPKTCLPPRKRAKTEDEKEQRRVERVLRNRRAAQSSRERKRQEVEALEKRNKELEHRLEVMQRDRVTLLAQLKQHMCRGSGLATRPSSSHDSPMLFTGIFDDEAGTSADSDALMTDLQLAAPDSPTVDPKSLSPELPPARLVAPTEAPAKFPKSILKTTASSAAPTTLPASVLPAAPVLAAPSKPVSSDQTQRPAEMLCDPQCRSEVTGSEASTSWSPLTSTGSFPFRWMLALLLQAATIQSVVCGMLSTLQRPLTTISTCLSAGSPIRPTPAILTTAMWLLTHRWTMGSSSTGGWQARRRPTPSPPHLAIPTSSTSSSRPPFPAPRTTRQRTLACSSTTLRTWLLQKLLTSSPTLARPLEVATMAALRLAAFESSASSGVVERPWVVLCERLARLEVGGGAAGGRGGVDQGSVWADDDDVFGGASQLPAFVADDVSLPPRETLMGLLWVLRRAREAKSDVKKTVAEKNEAGVSEKTEAGRVAASGIGFVGSE
jgi:transcriptional activator HAC1